jgi:hypothetical protein
VTLTADCLRGIGYEGERCSSRRAERGEYPIHCGNRECWREDEPEPQEKYAIAFAYPDGRAGSVSGMTRGVDGVWRLGKRNAARVRKRHTSSNRRDWYTGATDGETGKDYFRPKGSSAFIDLPATIQCPQCMHLSDVTAGLVSQAQWPGGED